MAQSTAGTGTTRRLPWLARTIAALPMPPAAGGVLVGAAVYAIFLLYTGAFSSTVGVLPGLRIERPWIPELIIALAIGFAPALTVYSARGSVRDFDALRPILRGSRQEQEALLAGIVSYRAGPLRLLGGLAALLLAVAIVTDPESWEVGGRRPVHDPTFVWLVGRNMVHAWVIVRAVALELAFAHRFSRLGAELAEVDLLDPEALRPFGRRGLRSVGLWMLLGAYHSLLYVGNWANYFLPVSLLSVGSFAVAALLLPVLGLRARIRREKEIELARIRTAVRRERDRELGAGASDREAGRLSDLLAYETRIRSVREWPFDLSTVVRFVVYVGIGLGSWVGGALVERGLDLALD